MPKRKGKFIGVFDSGFGGINVLRGIVKRLPAYDYMYLGDTARAPYGARAPQEVYKFTRQALDFLFAHHCELVILACNTASSDALRKIQREYVPKYHPRKKVLGVLIPAAEEAARITVNKKVGVIATEGTVKSGAFMRELKKLDAKMRVFQNACPLLVPIVEAGEQNSKGAKMILKDYLAPLQEKGIDTLVLGCTHYGIMEWSIGKIVGKNIRIVSGADVVPGKLKKYLSAHKDIEKKLDKNRTVTFYSTDVAGNFSALGSKFFGKKINAKRASLT